MSNNAEIAKHMISPKRCGGIGYGVCIECREEKRTEEKLVSRARIDGKWVIINDLRDKWVCVECRVARGEYKRICDGCGKMKESQYSPMRRWHWWCDDCVTPFLKKYMEMSEHIE